MNRKKLSIIATIAIAVFVLCIVLMLPNKTQKLITAVEDGNVEKVRTLLENGVDPNIPEYKPGLFWTLLETAPRRPLSVACNAGNYEIVSLLIQYGATAEYVPGTGWSPLRETLFYFHENDVQIVKLLLENGADMGLEEDDLPVFVAAKMVPQKYDIQKINGTVFSGKYDLEVAAGITEIVKMLLSDRSVDIQNSLGETLLILAVKSENIHLVEYLLSSKCDTSILDAKGKSAYDYAVQLGNANIVSLLAQ